MASEIAHVIYAKKYLDQYPRRDADIFLLGTLFPDIRRLAEGVSRRATHGYFSRVDLDLSGLNAFEAGWKYHIYCDMRRDEILNRSGFYDLPYVESFYGGPARILEDELLYDQYKNWEKLCYILRNPPMISLKIDVSQETIMMWYAILAKYFEKKPTNETIKIFMSKLPNLAEIQDEVIDVLEKLRNNRKVEEILIKVQNELLKT